MRFVSSALDRVVFPLLSRSGFLRSTVKGGPAVVTYHGVFPAGYKPRNPALDGNLVHSESLRQQLQLLKSRYHIVSPEDFMHWLDGKAEIPPRSVLLTCDDALQNCLTDMVPILREFDLQCIFFATGASVEQVPSLLWYEELYLMLLDASTPFAIQLADASIDVHGAGSCDIHRCWWHLVERLSQFDQDSRRIFLSNIRAQLKLPGNWKDRYVQNSALSARFLTLDLRGLEQLIAAGMTVGAHSLSHPVLAKAPAEIAQAEIVGCRSSLESALGRPVWAFGYPFGTPETVTDREFAFAEQAGFQCAFTNVGGGFGSRFRRFAVPRVHVTEDMSVSKFEAHLSGFYRLLRERLLGEREAA